MKTIQLSCDTCKDIANFEAVEIQVIFMTEQNEGRATKPYLCIQKLDLCGYCQDKILKGNYVFSEGAMGYNRYFFKKDKQLDE